MNLRSVSSDQAYTHSLVQSGPLQWPLNRFSYLFCRKQDPYQESAVLVRVWKVPNGFWQCRAYSLVTSACSPVPTSNQPPTLSSTGHVLLSNLQSWSHSSMPAPPVSSLATPILTLNSTYVKLSCNSPTCCFLSWYMSLNYGAHLP